MCAGLTLALAHVGSIPARADHETIAIDGNVDDLRAAIVRNQGGGLGGFLVEDPNTDTFTARCAFANGFEIDSGYVFLDFRNPDGSFADDLTLYVGFRAVGIIGDADADGNACTLTPGSPGQSGPPPFCTTADPCAIGTGEVYAIQVDPNCRGPVAPTTFFLGVTRDALWLLDNSLTPIKQVDGAFAVSGNFLEIRIDHYQDLLPAGDDPCDAQFQLFSASQNDGPGEDRLAVPPLLVEPSIEVTKRALQPNVCPNSEVPFRIVVTNNGLCHLDEVRVNDVIGAGMSFVSSTPPSTGDANNRSWTFTDLAPGDSIGIDLVARVDATCLTPTLVNDVSVEGDHTSQCRKVAVTVSDQAQATVNCSQPTCEIQGPDSVCPNSTGNVFTVTSDQPGATFSWAITGNGTIVGPTDGPSVTVNAGAAGSFTLTVTVSAGALSATVVYRGALSSRETLHGDGGTVCTGTCQKTVTVLPAPCVELAEASGPDSACVDSTVRLCATAVNCSDAPSDLEIRILAPNGGVLWQQTFTDVPPDSARRICVTTTMPACTTGQTVVFRVVVRGTNDCGTDEDTGQIPVRCGQCGGLCLNVLIMDEDAIDNDIQSIEDAAEVCGLEPSVLVNDNRPREIGNLPFRWNTDCPGGIVTIPTGQLFDEGVFTLPEDTPWSLESFVAGTVPQDQLDKIPNVLPLRTPELQQLVGQSFVAVVYDSDISMNYNPRNGNLKGARYGLFFFTVLDVIPPGSIPESGSSSSQWDLVIRVDAVPNDFCVQLPTFAGAQSVGTRSEPAVGAPESVASGERLELYRPSPNPFSGSMRIAYAVGGSGSHVELAVYDVAGRRVRDLVSGFRAPGRYEEVWDGRGNDGTRLPNGVYFVSSIVGGERFSSRVLFLR